MLRRSFVVLLVAASCAHGPAVRTGENLPLERVVIYRNGVGYFERAGRVSSDTVSFSVEPEHVSDFLATLSVLEKGGSSVKSAAFPIDSGEVERPAPGESPSATPASRMKRVVLSLDGRQHDLEVGYVAPQPVWKPTYRVVFDGDKPTLEAWGVVQNVSGEPWTNVKLSLVAGAPIAFESTLATPVIPQRPVVNDTGELISSVPRAETEIAPPPPEAAAAPMLEPPPSAPSRRMKMAMKSAAPMQSESYDVEGTTSTTRNLSLVAKAEVQAGATRYDVPERVTIPDGSATMVLLVSREVPGERVFLFAPDGGVPDSASHPFRVVRFRNDTPGLLERGPIAVFDHASFLGQGLLEPLAAGAQATVPFALERAIAVDAKRQSDYVSARIRRIEAGELTIARDLSLVTTWRVRNGTKEVAHVVLKQQRSPGMRLANAPKGTDDRVGEGNALVPVDVKPDETSEVVVDERRAEPMQVDWLSPYATEAVQAYFADPSSDPKIVAALKSAWALREELRQDTDEHESIVTQSNSLKDAAEQTRQSIAALGRAKTAADLREKLATRLGALESKLSSLTQKKVDLELRMNELRVRFTEAVRDLHLEVPPPKGEG